MVLRISVNHYFIYLFSHPEHLKLCIKNKQATLKTFTKPAWAVCKVTGDQKLQESMTP